MKLESITLKNFRSYYGKQCLRFSTDESRHITVIHGANGAGKTSLFVAFNWCLYGDKFVEAKFGDIGELGNRRALAEDENAETSVEIVFTYRHAQCCVKRKTSAGNNTELSLQLLNGLQERSFYDDGDSKGKDASDRVRLIIPEDVSVHFFFDGEQIYNFTKSENKKGIRAAVRDVLGIEDISRGVTHLKAIAADYRTELKQHAPETLAELLREREVVQNQRDNLSEDTERKRKEIDKAKELITGIDTRLKEIESSGRLAEERNIIEQALRKQEEDENDKVMEIRSLANHGFIPLAKSVILNALKILKENEITIRIPKSVLDDLLHQMNCLCGRPIHEESTEYKNIRKLMDKAVSSGLEYDAKETEGNLKNLLKDRVDGIPRQLKMTLGDLQRLKSEIKNNKHRLEEIKGNLGNFDDGEVAQLESARKGYESDIRDLEGHINRAKGRIEEIDKKIGDFDKKIEKEETKNAKGEQLQLCNTLANNALKAMEDIYGLYAADMREQIQQEANPIFRKLIWSADHFETIHLTENYRLLVLNNSGQDILPEMSAGQHQVLSLAFIGALAKIAVKNIIPNMENEPFPIVMDTPFGRLSSEHRERIAEVFPTIADQLVLFVTDEELRGKARQNLESRIGAEYKLQFMQEDKSTSTTTIERIDIEDNS